MSIESRAPLGRLAVSAIGLESFLGVGAIGGGAALMRGPRGEIIPLPSCVQLGTGELDVARYRCRLIVGTEWPRMLRVTAVTDWTFKATEPTGETDVSIYRAAIQMIAVAATGRELPTVHGDCMDQQPG